MIKNGEIDNATTAGAKSMKALHETRLKVSTNSLEDDDDLSLGESYMKMFRSIHPIHLPSLLENPSSNKKCSRKRVEL